MEDEKRFKRFADALKASGYEALHAFVTSIQDIHTLIAQSNPFIVFSAPDHLPPVIGEEGCVNVHEWLEDRGIPYVGSEPGVIELALSKASLKRKWLVDGIASPEFIELDGPAAAWEGQCSTLRNFPYIVKPEDAGNSRGITPDSIAMDQVGLIKAVNLAGESYGRLLVEEYLGLRSGFREFTCACVGNGKERIFMPAEILVQESKGFRLVTNEAKSGHLTDAIRISDAALACRIVDLAARAFNSAEVRDYSRCDIILADGKLWALEINGQPMVPDEWFGACAFYFGLSESQYLVSIVESAIRRKP